MLLQHKAALETIRKVKCNQIGFEVNSATHYP
jgi:hypothetical protein